MTLKHTYILTLFLCLSALLMGQDKETLEQQRDRILRDIKYTNQLLADAQQGQGQALQQLEAVQQKVSLRRRLIRTIDQEAVALQRAIDANVQEVADLESELEALKKEYAKLVYSSYKNKGAEDKLLYIFASDGLYQAWMRMSHLKELARYQESQGERIEENKAAVILKNEELVAQKKEKLVLLDEQKKAKAELDRDRAEVQRLIQDLKGQEQELKAKLKKQEDERRKLDQAIKKIIADNLRKANKSASKGYALTPEEELDSRSFSKNKGKLPWPVEKGVVTGRFGTHPHPTIAGVEVTNNGIDIATDKGADSRVIFDGEVTGIIEIPGSGMAIVVKHGGYRTVYSNLKEVFVEKGQMIETKQVIGQLMPEGERSKAHLEIWQVTSEGMKKLDPETWVAR